MTSPGSRPLAVVAAILVVASAVVVPSVAASEEDATFDYEGDELALAAAPGQVVSGETTLDPGSEVTVQLRASGGDSPFAMRRHATVGGDGEFLVVFDPGVAEPGTHFTAHVRHDGERISERHEGAIVDGEPELGLATPNPTVDEGGTVDLSIVVGDRETVTLSVGGPAVNYELVAELHDGDGDGEVVVEFDTALAGTDASPISTVSRGDEVALVEETGLDSTLDPAEYGISLDVDDLTVAVGRLTVDGDAATPPGTPADSTPAPGDGDPELGQTVTSVQQNGTLDLTVYLGNASAARLDVGGPESGYELVATVRDGTGDDRVVVEFTPGATAGEEPTLAARDGGDDVTIERETDLDGRLEPGDYPVNLGRGVDDGDVVDVATIVVREGAPSTPTPTATPTPVDVSTTPSDGLPADPGVLALGGVAAVGIGAATVLRLRN